MEHQPHLKEGGKTQKAFQLQERQEVGWEQSPPEKGLFLCSKPGGAEYTRLLCLACLTVGWFAL